MTMVHTGSQAIETRIGALEFTPDFANGFPTAAITVFELSGDYLIVLPLILATVVATAASKALGAESVYETELRKRGLGWHITREGRQLRDSADEP
jgi:H+/Cl- antiporter ClcA